MGRLIDADKLKKDYLDLPNCYNGFSDTYDKAYIIGVLDEQPTVDAVQVVRCVDCKHIEILNGYYYARCKWHGRLFDSFGKADIRTWYCADGERKEE